MIKLEVVKSILNFYLQTRLKEWGIVDNDQLAWPVDKTISEKISFLCSLNNRLPAIQNNSKELENICNTYISDRETVDAKEHRSSRMGGFAGYLTDYPFMALSLRAIRSYILNCVHEQEFANKTAESIKKEINYYEALFNRDQTEADAQLLAAKKRDLETFNLINYHKTEFLDVIKYEDKKSSDPKFQHIKSFDDFVLYFTQPTKEQDSFSLLNRFYNKWRSKFLLISGDTSVSSISFLNQNDKGKEKESETVNSNAVVAEIVPAQEKEPVKPAQNTSSPSLASVSFVANLAAEANQAQIGPVNFEGPTPKTRAERRKATRAKHEANEAAKNKSALGPRK